MKPGIKRLLLGLAIGFGATVVSYQVILFSYQVSATRAHHRHLEHLHLIGESLEIDAHRPPAVPGDSENFARAEVIQDLIRQSKLGDDDWETPARAEEIPGFGRVTGTRRSVRYVEDPPIMNSFADLDSEEEAAKSILSYCHSHEDLLTAFSRAAFRPRSNLEKPYEEGLTMANPEFQIFQDLAHLLALRGRANQITGDHDSAAEDALTLIRLHSHIRQEPTLIHQLLGAAVLDRGIHLIRNGLREHTWTDGHLAQFETELSEIHFAESTLRAFRMERAVFALTMRHLVKDGGHRDGKLKGLNIPFPLRKSSGMVRAWQYDNIRKFSEIIQEECLSDNSGHPLYHDFPDHVSFQDPIGEITGSTLGKIRYLMVTIALPAYESIIDRARRSQFHADGARIGIALERYRLRHGEYPDALSETTLMPYLGSSIPGDPFSKEPLKYERIPDKRYQVYSIGPNRIDESGLHRRDLSEGDWIWILELPADFDRETYFERSRQ